MDLISYIGNLYDRFNIYYNTSRNIKILDESIDILAQFTDVQVRTLLTQKDIIDSFETNEICYVKKVDNVDISSLTAFTEFLKKSINTFVQPKRDHMCTHITGVVVTECPLDKDVTRFVQKFKFSRSYLFSLHGWSEIRLLVINPKIEKIITNKAGKKVIKFYRFN